MICKKMEALKKLFFETLSASFNGEAWTEYVPLDLIADAMVNGIDIEKLKEAVAAKADKRPFTLSLMRRDEMANHNCVAGYWEICAVRGDEQIVIPFNNRYSKVLYAFFMLHPGQKITLAGLQKYHGEFKRIALALYTDSEQSHTKATLDWANKIATTLCSRYGSSEKVGTKTNKERSTAFSRAKKSVLSALGEAAGNYVIQGTTGDEKRVLRLPGNLVRVPEAFRDAVIGWQGGFAI